jgi:hypothetical protein
VTVQAKLYWTPCDQSVTPLQPFYVVHYRGRPEPIYVRVDGEIYTSITHGRAGL